MEENPIFLRDPNFGGKTTTIFGNIQPPQNLPPKTSTASTSAVSLADGTASLEPYEIDNVHPRKVSTRITRNGTTPIGSMVMVYLPTFGLDLW